LLFSGGVDSSVILNLTRPPSQLISLHLGASACADIAHTPGATALSTILGTFAAAAERPITSLSGPALSCLLSKAANAGVESVLSGEGADELFGGYAYYTKRHVGHPLLTARLRDAETTWSFLPLLRLYRPTDGMRHLLESKSGVEWLTFDRTVRLSEHLCLLNSDIPSLLAGIEARLPYLSAWSLRSRRPPRKAKRPIYEVARRIGVAAIKKRSLYVRCDSLGEKWLLQACEELSSDEYVATMFKHPTSLPALVRQVGLVSKRLPPTWRSYMSEIIARAVVGLWTWRAARAVQHPMHTVNWAHTDIASPYDGPRDTEEVLRS
jgi:hypothetical protein